MGLATTRADIRNAANAWHNACKNSMDTLHSFKTVATYNSTVLLNYTVACFFNCKGVPIPLFTDTFDTKYKAKLIHRYQYQY